MSAAAGSPPTWGDGGSTVPSRDGGVKLLDAGLPGKKGQATGEAVREGEPAKKKRRALPAQERYVDGRSAMLCSRASPHGRNMHELERGSEDAPATATERAVAMLNHVADMLDNGIAVAPHDMDAVLQACDESNVALSAELRGALVSAAHGFLFAVEGEGAGGRPPLDPWNPRDERPLERSKRSRSRSPRRERGGGVGGGGWGAGGRDAGVGRRAVGAGAGGRAECDDGRGWKRRCEEGAESAGRESCPALSRGTSTTLSAKELTHLLAAPSSVGELLGLRYS